MREKEFWTWVTIKTRSVRPCNLTYQLQLQQWKEKFALPPRPQHVSPCYRIRSVKRAFGLQKSGTTILIRSVGGLPDSQQRLSSVCVTDSECCCSLPNRVPPTVVAWWTCVTRVPPTVVAWWTCMCINHCEQYD